MKLRNWKRVALAGATMGTCFTAGVYAQDTIEQVQAYLRADYSVIVNGTKVALENPVLIYNETSYLPLKEMSSYLGAAVNWSGNTKSIYVNSKVTPEQLGEGDNVKYEEIKMMNPIAYTVNYLGAQYPVLMMADENMYYRLKDIQRMNINTKGLTKIKEIYTKEFYVSEAELSKVWKGQFELGYGTTGIIITGENDPVKLDFLRDYTDTNKTYTMNNITYLRRPIIIDALPEENKYSYLFSENNHFYRMTLTLTKWSNDDNYLVGSSSTEDLEASNTK